MLYNHVPVPFLALGWVYFDGVYSDKWNDYNSSQLQPLDHIFLLRKRENVTVKPLQIIRSGTADALSSFTSPAPSPAFMLLNFRHADISACNGKHFVFKTL